MQRVADGRKSVWAQTSENTEDCKGTQRLVNPPSELQPRYSPVRFRPAPLRPLPSRALARSFGACGAGSQAPESGNPLTARDHPLLVAHGWEIGADCSSTTHGQSGVWCRAFGDYPPTPSRLLSALRPLVNALRRLPQILWRLLADGAALVRTVPPISGASRLIGAVLPTIAADRSAPLAVQPSFVAEGPMIAAEQSMIAAEQPTIAAEQLTSAADGSAITRRPSDKRSQTVRRSLQPI